MSTITVEQLWCMHNTFCLVAGVDQKYAANERIWYDVAKAGYICDDIKILVAFVKKENARQDDPDYRRRITILGLCGDLERMDADIATAKAELRNRRQPGIHPIEDPIFDTVRSASDILKRLDQNGRG